MAHAVGRGILIPLLRCILLVRASPAPHGLRSGSPDHRYLRLNQQLGAVVGDLGFGSCPGGTETQGNCFHDGVPGPTSPPRR
jgi:hypothetical protein